MSGKISTKTILILIIFLAFLVRIIGVNYGLPLWLFDDEPSFVTSALKMLEAKTLVPRLHQAEFANLLYYPPYLSYLYLVPFSLAIGVKYLFFYGDKAMFVNYLLTDASQFFIIARLINVLLSTLTVWLVYKIAKNVWNDNRVALLSAFFLVSSVTHIHLSPFAIHWVPATLFFTLGIYALSHPKLPAKKRYLLCSLVAGIGFGFSIMSVFIMLFALCHLAFVDRKILGEASGRKYLYKSLGAFFVLAIIPLLLYPRSFGFLSDTTVSGREKTALGVIMSPYWFLKSVIMTEPVLMLFALIGLGFLYKHYKQYFYVVAAFIVSSSLAFYFAFRAEQRFTVYMIPLLALLAGYGFFSLFTKLNSKKVFSLALATLLLIPIAGSLKLGYLKLNNDNRAKAREWVLKNIPTGSKIITYADLTRLPSNRDAISEQEEIDSASLRRVDLAERRFDKNPRNYNSFYVLNLYTVANKEFYENLESYIKTNHFRYLLLSLIRSDNLPYLPMFDASIKKADLIVAFGDKNNIGNFTSGSLGDIFHLLSAKSVGEPVLIYKLP